MAEKKPVVKPTVKPKKEVIKDTIIDETLIFDTPKSTILNDNVNKEIIADTPVLENAIIESVEKKSETETSGLIIDGVDVAETGITDAMLEKLEPISDEEMQNLLIENITIEVEPELEIVAVEPTPTVQPVRVYGSRQDGGIHY